MLFPYENVAVFEIIASQRMPRGSKDKAPLAALGIWQYGVSIQTPDGREPVPAVSYGAFHQDMESFPVRADSHRSRQIFSQHEYKTTAFPKRMGGRITPAHQLKW